MTNHLGEQYIIELYGCNAAKLNNIENITLAMNEAAIKADATIVQTYFHQFNPQGVSGTIVISESHMNIHTWPEYGYAAIDLFTCGSTLRPERAMKYLAEQFEASECKFDIIKRGENFKKWSTKNTDAE